MPIDIVLDAMGSDKAPDPEIRGAILACRQLDVRVHLVGPEDLLRPKLREALKTYARPAFPGTPGGFPGNKKPRLPDLYGAGQRVDQHGGQGRAGRAFEARLFHAGGAEDGARGARSRIYYGRQYRCGDGDGQDGAGVAGGG